MLAFLQLFFIALEMFAPTWFNSGVRVKGASGREGMRKVCNSGCIGFIYIYVYVCVLCIEKQLFAPCDSPASSTVWHNLSPSGFCQKSTSWTRCHSCFKVDPSIQLQNISKYVVIRYQVSKVMFCNVWGWLCIFHNYFIILCDIISKHFKINSINITQFLELLFC